MSPLLGLLLAAAAGASPPRFEAAPEDCRAAERRAQSQLQQLASLPPSARTFENTSAALDGALVELEEALAPAAVLLRVGPAERADAEECASLLARFEQELPLRQELHRALSELGARRLALEPEGARLLERQRQELELGGHAAKDPEAARAAARRVARLELDFLRAVDEARPRALLPRERLRGLTDAEIAELEPEEGMLRLPAHGPAYEHAIARLREEEARRALHAAHEDRAERENASRLGELLRERMLRARLLGRRSHGELMLERTLLGAPAGVIKLLQRLDRALARASERDLDALAALKRSLEPGSGPPRAWDRALLLRLQRELALKLAEGAEREHFPAHETLERALRLSGQWLGFSVRAVPAEAWHPEAAAWELHEAGAKQPFARLYADLLARPGKSAEPETVVLRRPRRAPDGGRTPAAAALLASFPRGGLSHEELRALLRELGRALRLALARPRHGRFTRDLAPEHQELVPLVFEQWAWEPELLRRLSGRRDDPARPAPPSLLAALVSARRLSAALERRRLVALARLDQQYHSQSPPRDPHSAYVRAFRGQGLIPAPEKLKPASALVHLADHDARLYAYLLSEAWAIDVYSRLKKSPLDSMLGQEFRQKLLEPGSSRDELDSLKSFLGREPNEEAYIQLLTGE